MNGLAVQGVSFAYGAQPTLSSVSLQIAPGELLGLLGPNGAGKTTLVTLIAGLLQPAAGRMSVQGHDLATAPLLARSQLGLVFQSISLDRLMTVAENLRFAAGLQGLPAQRIAQRMAALSEQLSLTPYLQRTVLTLSGGQQRLVDIARAMMHEPAVLVLDEPTHGLDVMARQQVWTVLDRLRHASGGPAVLVTTHLMDEAAACDRVSFLRKGELLWTGTPAEALAQLPPKPPAEAPHVPVRSLTEWFVWRAGQ